MGVACISGGALLRPMHVATVLNTLSEDVDAADTFRAYALTQSEESCSVLTVDRFWSSIF